MKCSITGCNKPLPSVAPDKQGAKGLLCYEHFLMTASGRDLLSQPYTPPEPLDTGAGGPGRYIDQVHIHHSASESGNAASFDYYHSVVLGWGEIAYNLIICNGFGGGDGEVQLGKTDDRYPFSVGVDSLNRRALAVCYVGLFSPGKYPTPKQWASGVKAGHNWIDLYPTIKPAGVGGHRQFNANSACPGFEDAKIAEMVSAMFGDNVTPKMEDDDMAQPVDVSKGKEGTKWQTVAKAGTRFQIHLSSGDGPGVPEPAGDVGFVVIFKGKQPVDKRAIRAFETIMEYTAPSDGIYIFDSVDAHPQNKDKYIVGPSLVVQAG